MLEDKESCSSIMGKDDKTHRDIWFGQDGILRLERLAQGSGASQSEVTREALIEYELKRSEFRDTVCHAVLNLFRVSVPDGQYDPSDDPRQEDAVHNLGELLNSPFAAEGIQLAFTLLMAENPQMMIDLRVPSFQRDEEHKVSETSH